MSALESDKRALNIRLKVLGEEHSQTADSYHSLGVTQHSLGDFLSALGLDKRALNVRLKVLGEEHSQTADNYHSLGAIQHSLGDFVSALKSAKLALDIRMKVHGEEDPRTVNGLVKSWKSCCEGIHNERREKGTVQLSILIKVNCIFTLISRDPDVGNFFEDDS